MHQKRIETVSKYFEEWKHYLREGDVLLFRGESIYSKFLKVSGDSIYTHVGVASWHNKVLECAEFHESYGGRTVNLENYIATDNRQIDVFRPIPVFASLKYNLDLGEVDVSRKDFVGTNVTDCMRGLTGIPYGWKRIWWITKHKAAGIRIFYNPSKTMDDTTQDEIIYPVCSTAVAHCFSKNGYDLVSQKADEWTEPADIARSTRIHKIFNIKNGVLKIVG